MQADLILQVASPREDKLAWNSELVRGVLSAELACDNPKYDRSQKMVRRQTVSTLPAA